MDQYFGIKEIYQVALKANDKGCKIGNRILEPGEPVTYFEHIQIANLAENIQPIAARGGKRNDPLVIWEDRKDVTFRMQSGVLSNVGLSLLSNARVLDKPQELYLSNSEIVVLDNNGKGILNNHTPAENKPFFCFLYENKNIQEKLIPNNVDYEQGIVDFGVEYGGKSVMIDYRFLYQGNSQIFILERERFTGTFELEGKIYRKGEEDGINRTTLFRMPRVRIASSLNMTVGENVSPTISSFNVIATPYPTSFSPYTVMELYNLDDDIS